MSIRDYEEEENAEGEANERVSILKLPLYGLLILATVTGIGALYHAIATARDERKYSYPGKLVDIGGHRLHINCTGSTDRGAPTVVLESGAGNWALFWSRVQPELSKVTRVISYDRAGLGWSDSGQGPRTSVRIAEELRRLLINAGIEGPYVLVGHSMGGYHVRMFAHKFPDEVAGVVLVDASHEDQFSCVSSERFNHTMRQFKLARTWAPLGVVRLIGEMHLSRELDEILNKFPAEVRDLNRAIYYSSRSWKTAWDEFVCRRESAAQVRQTGSLGDKPLVVVTALGEIDDEEIKASWVQKQLEMVRLSSNSTHILDEPSGHYIQLEHPEIIIKAVTNMVEAASAVRGRSHC